MGWASGLQAGIQLGNAYNQGQERRRMEEIQNAAPTELQDYSPSQIQQIQGLQRTDAYDVQAIPGAEGRAPTLRYVPKQGLDLQGDMPGAPIDVAPQRMTEFLGQRYEGGLAPERMETMRTRAMANAVSDPRVRQQMLMSVTGEERAQAAESRAAQGFETQQRSANLGIKKLERDDATESRYASFNDFASQNPEMTAAQLKAAAFKEFKFTPEQWEKAVTTRLNIKNNELATFTANIKDKLKGKNLAQLGSLYNTDPDFDDKTDLAIVPGKGGAVTLNFIDKASGKVTGSQSFKNEALATEYLNVQATQPEVVGTWLLGTESKQQQIAASKAAVTASGSTAALSNERLTTVKEDRENRGKAGDIAAEFEGLSDIEKAGPKGVGLIRQFNMANAKAGGQISLGAQQRPGQTMTDIEKANLTEYYKWENDDRNARLSQSEKDKKATRMGVYQFVNPTANTVQSGLGSNPYGNTSATPKQGDSKQQGIQTTAPKLTSMNTRLLGNAGKMGYNVELPDGTTRVMEKDELEDLGYRFPSR